MSLQLKNLHCYRGHRTLFTNLDISVEPGRVLVVAGKNGCGKSTLLKIISGLRQADEGEVFWNGLSLQENATEFEQQMIWLSHRNGLNESLTAKENIQYSTSLANYTDVNISSILERVGLKGYANTPVRQFSAGMKRRLAMSRLVSKPAKLWLLDEPQSALDKAGIRLLDELIIEHVTQGGAVVMSSHHDVSLTNITVDTLTL